MNKTLYHHVYYNRHRGYYVCEVIRQGFKYRKCGFSTAFNAFQHIKKKLEDAQQPMIAPRNRPNSYDEVEAEMIERGKDLARIEKMLTYAAFHGDELANDVMAVISAYNSRNSYLEGV